MKTIKNNVIVLIVGVLLLSCNKDEDEVVKPKVLLAKVLEPYYDTDANCDDPTFINSTCCDVYGRILVVPNNSYDYTYTARIGCESTLGNIVWTGRSGSITLVSGQGKHHATFKFGADFVNGTIAAQWSRGDCFCGNPIEIKKTVKI